jgi:hypothetical protein
MNPSAPHDLSSNEIESGGAPSQPTPQANATEVHDYLHPIVEPPKHTYHPKAVRTLLIVLVVVSLLGVGLAVLATLLPTMSKPVTNQTNTPTTTSKTTEKLTAAKEIERVKAYFKGTTTAKSSLSLPVKTDGNNFYTVIPDVAEVKSVAGEVAPADVTAMVTAIHKVLDYDKLERTVWSDGADNTNYLADYRHKDVLCQITVTKPADTKAKQFIEAKCLDMTQYEAYAAIQRPFYNVYTPAQAGSVEYAFTGKPAAKPSNTSGYHLAELPVGTVIANKVETQGQTGMFYQTPDAIWHYFKDRAQKMIECEQYRVRDELFAYGGQQCYSLAKDTITTVIAPKKK